ncbi:MAG: hypothetical protein ABII71_02175 [Candidatus Micrarchaeota archaeon]
MFGRHSISQSPEAKKKSPRERKRAMIKECEKKYGVSLTEEELDGLLDAALGSGAVSGDTKGKVRKCLVDKMKKGKESKIPKKGK